MAEGLLNVEMRSTIEVFNGTSSATPSISSTSTENQGEAQNNNRSSLSLADSGLHEDPQLDSLQVHCKCPCGRTNFSHTLNPPSTCLSRRNTNTQQFAELDLTVGVDSRRAKDAMSQHLSAETENLKNGAFVDYGMAVYRYAKSTNGIEAHLKQMLRMGGRTCSNLKTFDNLYDAVTEGSNFLNFDSLDKVMTECEYLTTKETKEQVCALTAQKEYKAEFNKFAQHRVFSDINSLQELRPPIQEGFFKSLKIKIEENFAQFTVDRSYQFKQLIKKTLQIPEQVFLQLVNIEEGCTQITYRVLGNFVIEIDTPKKEVLASNNISMLEYNGHVYYCCCEVSMDICKTLYDSNQSHSLSPSDIHNDKDHSPDCPHLLDKKLKCPLRLCKHCRTQIQFCFFELHECTRIFSDCGLYGPNTEGHQSEQIQHKLKPENRVFNVTATSTTNRPNGECQISLNEEFVTIKHSDGIARWPYRAIRSFGAYEDPNEAKGWFLFESGRRGQFGVGKYCLVLSQEKLAEMLKSLNEVTNISLRPSLVSAGNSPTESEACLIHSNLYHSFQLNSNSMTVGSTEPDYSTGRHNHYCLSPPLPPRDYRDGDKYKKWKTESSMVKDESPLPFKVKAFLLEPSKPLSPDEDGRKKFNDEKEQHHHVYSVDQEGLETVINVSPTVKRRRSTGGRLHVPASSRCSPDIDGEYVMFTKKQTIDHSSHVGTFPMSL